MTLTVKGPGGQAAAQWPIVVTAKPTPTPEPPGYSFGDGSHIVGTDVLPGTYRTRAGGRGCYWERLSGFSGDLRDIIANENTDAPEVVTIGPADKGFNSKRCGRWTRDLSPITSGPDQPFGEGTYIVGVDIAAGTWRSSGGSGCYWQRVSGFGGTLDEILANDNVDGSAIVTIRPGDKGFSSRRCGTWMKVQ